MSYGKRRMLDTSEPRIETYQVKLTAREAELLETDRRMRVRGDQTRSDWIRAAILARFVKHRLLDSFVHECIVCGTPFEARRHDARYCPDNTACRAVDSRERRRS